MKVALSLVVQAKNRIANNDTNIAPASPAPLPMSKFQVSTAPHHTAECLELHCNRPLPGSRGMAFAAKHELSHAPFQDYGVRRCKHCNLGRGNRLLVCRAGWCMSHKKGGELPQDLQSKFMAEASRT